MPEHLKEKQLAKAVKQAIRFLESQGLNVSQLSVRYSFRPEKSRVWQGFVFAPSLLCAGPVLTFTLKEIQTVHSPC